MNTFTVVHAVDTSTGVARIGKAHVIKKHEEMAAALDAERTRKAAVKNRIADVTKERILELKNAGMDYVEIALELNCSVSVIYSRLRERS